ncbi:MAG: S-layer homology domain-containing protein, partial [Oscillibacter sp.]|nr:S-layer homology domain-containing protein [Oscillibacter sp.]MDY5712315.1 S-layer homology domain-containing protein [Oscillospiraceae bacterium]
MKRKILSLILVFAMTVSLLTVGTGAVEPTYGDTAGHWAESSIERWSAYGIIQGSNGQFDPNGQLTCAQLATILAKLLKLPAAKDAGFTDNTADAWYYDAINRCAAAGILNGNGDGTVTPDAPISRERAIVMLGRALGIEPIRKPDLTKYTDAAKVAPYAQGMVAAMIEAGIVGGVTADELAPQDNINRASTVTILDRAIS